jgi:hypothetical protein
VEPIRKLVITSVVTFRALHSFLKYLPCGFLLDMELLGQRHARIWADRFHSCIVGLCNLIPDGSAAQAGNEKRVMRASARSIFFQSLLGSPVQCRYRPFWGWFLTNSLLAPAMRFCSILVCGARMSITRPLSRIVNRICLGTHGNYAGRKQSNLI